MLSLLERARNGLLDLEKEISILKTSSALKDPKSWKLMDYMPYSIKTRNCATYEIGKQR
jgi:hypothetical protein